MKFEEILKIPPYSLCKEDKEELLTHRLLDLTELHKEKCPEYAKILLSLNFDGDSIESYKKIPFLPVRLFKELL